MLHDMVTVQSAAAKPLTGSSSLGFNVLVPKMRNNADATAALRELQGEDVLSV